jgi:hypothetical protein
VSVIIYCQIDHDCIPGSYHELEFRITQLGALDFGPLLPRLLPDPKTSVLYPDHQDQITYKDSGNGLVVSGIPLIEVSVCYEGLAAASHVD